MASITISSGKYAVYRNGANEGVSPWTNIIPESDGAACVVKSRTNQVWVFYITAGALYCKISADWEGTIWGGTITVEASAIKDGVPGAVQLNSGRIMVFYWKTVGGVDKWYSAGTVNFGGTWTIAEVTT